MDKRYQLVFVVTHINKDHINKLISSILSNNKWVKVFIVIISQETKFSVDELNDLVDLETINHTRCGLSKARNVGLNYLIKRGVLTDHIMFPDDDTTFDDTFFRYYNSIVNKNISYLIPIYNEGSKIPYIGGGYIEGAKVPIKKTSLIGSPNQIIPYEGNEKLIYFNEDLGVGAKYGSCEDYDLFLRLNQAGIYYIYSGIIYNYHPSKSEVFKNLDLKNLKNRFEKYSSGFCYIIFRYKQYEEIPLYLIKPLGASLLYLMRLNFKLSYAYLFQFFIRLRLLFSFSH